MVTRSMLCSLAIVHASLSAATCKAGALKEHLIKIMVAVPRQVEHHRCKERSTGCMHARALVSVGLQRYLSAGRGVFGLMQWIGPSSAHKAAAGDEHRGR